MQAELKQEWARVSCFDTSKERLGCVIRIVFRQRQSRGGKIWHPPFTTFVSCRASALWPLRSRDCPDPTDTASDSGPDLGCRIFLLPGGKEKFKISSR